MSEPPRLPANPALRSLLGGGWLYFALFVLVHAILAFATHMPAALDLLCLALVALPQLLLVLRRGLDVAALQTWLVCAALVAATALGLWNERFDRPEETYAAWFLGAVAFDLLVLAILGRFRAAWLTMAAVLVVAMVWAVADGRPVGEGVGLVVRHVATLLIGTALAISLRRSNAAFAGFRALRLRRGAQEEAARAQASARRSAVEQVLDRAGPTLQAIADGRRFTPEDRRQMLVLEGSLRDQIRSPRLVRGPLLDSVAAARRRGVDVLLMDEAEEVDPGVRADAVAWLAERLDGAPGGGFVGRVRVQDDALRVSAVADDAGETRSFPLPGGR